MTDTLSRAARSERMSRVRDHDTRPELAVRRTLHAAGLRYRLHRRIANVRPDLIFPGRKLVVFVHGCMWHQHPDPNCKLARMPKSRLDFWRPKLNGNRMRDERQRAKLEEIGWSVLTIWECEVRDNSRLAHLVDQIRAKPPRSIRNDSRRVILKTPLLPDVAGGELNGTERPGEKRRKHVRSAAMAGG